MMLGARPIQRDIYCPAGTKWEEEFAFTTYPENVAVNLTGSIFRGQIKRSPQTAVLGEIEITIVDAAAGKIKVRLPLALQRALDLGENVSDPLSQYVYDIEWLQAGQTEPMRFIQGALVIDPEVTEDVI
jgi:hypothetical protein